MNRLFIIIVIVVVWLSCTQTVLAQRHVFGYKGLGANWGMIENKNNKIFGLSYLHYNKRGNTWIYELTGAETKENDLGTYLKNTQITLNMAFVKTLITSRNHDVYLNIGIGPVGTFEKQQSSSSEVDSLNYFKEEFSFGLQGIADLEVFLSSKIALNIQFKEMYIRRSFIDNTQEKLTIGLRFIFP